MRGLAMVMALASTALATPAMATDHTWYGGVEGGLSLVEDTDFDVSGDAIADVDNFFSLDHKRGVDLDLIGGYDFGMIRAEFEAGYKRASLDEVSFATSGISDVDGNVRVYSAMANLLLDFGGDNGWSGYVGGGAGLANVRYKIDLSGPNGVGRGSDSDRSLAFQGIAGIRKSISNNVDLGLKYRYFVANKLDFDIVGGEASGRFRSHSLLASLIFNFAPPPPPPVIAEPVIAPPPPPATQTCYDGSVILATDTCPQPPVETPPAPPEPAPERG